MEGENLTTGNGTNGARNSGITKIFKSQKLVTKTTFENGSQTQVGGRRKKIKGCTLNSQLSHQKVNRSFVIQQKEVKINE